MLRKTHDIPEDWAKWFQNLGSKTSLDIWVQGQKVMSVMTLTFICRFIDIELGGTISEDEKAESLYLYAGQSEDFWWYYVSCLTWGVLWERIGCGFFYVPRYYIFYQYLALGFYYKINEDLCSRITTA